MQGNIGLALREQTPHSTNFNQSSDQDLNSP